MRVLKRFKQYWLIFIISLIGTFSFGQNLTQNIRGTVLDIDSELPLTGATITVLDSDPLLGVASDESGTFNINDLLLGYYDLEVSSLGYESIILSQLLLESGKELVLNIKLATASENLKEVVLIGKRVNAEAQSPVSLYTITQEEVLRFPGTFYDPSRLAMTFAGVASTDDQANNIAIRGNSPNSMSWRLEGVEIVNPNHTSNAGTFSDRPTQNGGGVNILSAQVLGTSNFLTGAFPAQYGNSLSGIMDMKLRAGNNSKYEFTAQAGLVGIDVAAEGPFSSKSDASFLINYRYSFIGLLTDLGVEVGDEDIRFQDLAFKFNLPTRNAGTFSIFGMGGKSENIFFGQRDTTAWEVQKDRFDILYDNEMGAFGITHSIPVGIKTSWSSAFIVSGRRTYRIANRLDDNLDLSEASYDELGERKTSLTTKVNHRINENNRFTIGLFVNEVSHDIFSIDDEIDINYDDASSNIVFQPYVNYQSDFANNRIQLNLGLHYQYFGLNETKSLEPRASLSYNVNAKQRLSLAYGLHGQIQLPQVYYSNSPTQSNDLLEFTKSHHFVLGYENNFSRSTSLKAELYYQSLFDVPISQDPNSSFSVLNLLEGFVLEDLVNEGTGTNYGFELSVYKRFSNNIFFLVNGSIFESKYTGADGIERDTRFNNNYIGNFTTGREFRWTKNGREKVFGLNARIAYYGGFRETPIDVEESMLLEETVYLETEAFSIKQPDFFKMDLRLYIKNNKPNYSSTLSLDVQNATNQENVAYSYFDPQQGEVILKNQLGLIPILSYRIEF